MTAATSSPQALVKGAFVRPGTHVDLVVGAHLDLMIAAYPAGIAES